VKILSSIEHCERRREKQMTTFGKGSLRSVREISPHCIVFLLARRQNEKKTGPKLSETKKNDRRHCDVTHRNALFFFFV